MSHHAGAWNWRTSHEKKETVLDILALNNRGLSQRGIAAGRLQVEGAGSSLPIADNATRYGRGLNRRIEISLTGE